ncbi:MAG: hypothetical protein KAS32_04750 [Candidatus Peribacteraceae bacterium]|nr:hypothetical protein [Candidatus Peribacteraceae bacterium]
MTLLKEANGQISTMRAMSALVIVTVLFNWTYHNVTQGVFVSLNIPEVIAMIGTLGAKAIQRGQEKS